jgi:hypothetical protein
MQVTRVAPDNPVPSLMHRRRVMVDRITYVGLDVHKESNRRRGGIRRSARRGAGVRPDCEHADGVGPFAAQARRRRREPAILLRGPCGYGIQRHPPNTASVFTTMPSSSSCIAEPVLARSRSSATETRQLGPMAAWQIEKDTSSASHNGRRRLPDRFKSRLGRDAGEAGEYQVSDFEH